MPRINNTAEVQMYGKSSLMRIKIYSHFDRPDMIEIQIGVEDNRIVVYGEDLKRAIDNCMNVGE